MITHKERREKIKTHGLSNTRIYRIYSGMKDRCYNERTPLYKYYGARGIKVCEWWLDRFSNFYEWAISNGYEENLSIDRIDNDGDYKPSNCRWVNMTKQANNKSNNKKVSIGGESKSIAEWSEIYGVDASLSYSRHSNGVRGEDIFIMKKRSANRWTEKNIDSLKEKWGNEDISIIAKDLGRSENAIRLKAKDVGLEYGKFYRKGLVR